MSYEPLYCPRCFSVLIHINQFHLKPNEAGACVGKKKYKGANVYLIRDCDQQRLKIGFAEIVKRRFNQIRCATTNRMEFIGSIPGSRKNEQIVHSRFKKFNVQREWFEDATEIIEWFSAHPQFKKSL